MAEVAEMGEVDELHANEEVGVVLNGDISKDVDMDNKDVDMDSKDGTLDSKDVSMDSKDVDMESGEEEIESKDTSMDEDSRDSEESNDVGSQGSQGSQDQDSNLESEQIKEDTASQRTDDGDTNSLPQNEEANTENSNLSSQKVEDENGSLCSNEEAVQQNEKYSFDIDSDNDENEGNSLKNNSDNEENKENLLKHDIDKEGNGKNNLENDSDNEENKNNALETDDSDNEESTEEPAKNSLANDNSKDSTSKKHQGDLNESKEELDKSEGNTESTEERATSVASSSQEIHEIDDDDKSEKSKHHETIELNSEDEGDVMIVESPKTNGTAEIIDLVETPEKKEKPEKKVVVTPRRSSRNINKNRNYVESDKEDTPPPPPAKEAESEGSDIEEVLPQDPLAVNDQITVERIPSIKKPPENSSTIVVKDTKRLVEIASKSNTNTNVTAPTGKKEPTLVIIDTNSILSGRGPVPVTKNSQTVSTSNFTSVLPVAVPAQGMYPPNMRATITPIPVNSASIHTPRPPPPIIAPPAPLLPTLTDDMFVVEAPSFIVPYVYEKPPVRILKDFVGDLKKYIQDSKKDKKEKRSENKKGDKGKTDDKGKSEEAKDKDKKEKKKGERDDSDATYSSESEDEEEKGDIDPKKPYSYFDSPLGKFFIDIGLNQVQEYVQTDLLKQQKRKRDREQGSNPETNKTIVSLMKNLEFSKENNEHFRMETKKCDFCNFKTESHLAMAYHLETPHMKNFVYKCNFCPYEVRSPHDILFHMEAEHAVRGHLERAPAFHQCPSCPFEDNQKGKLSRHLVVCARKFKPDRNLEPPADWEPPAKIPRVPKMRATGLNATVAAYQTLNKGGQYQFLSKMQLQSNTNAALQRGRGRPTLGPNIKSQPILRPQGMVFKQQAMSGGSVLVPTNYQLSGNQVFQVVGGPDMGGRLGPVPGHMAFVPSSAPQGSMQNAPQVKKPSNTPSISITPLPRGTASSPSVTSKPGDTNSKNSFVICEICDGYIKDLEQLRNHMQWIHKIKIHPKMIYNRPPLNCQKCQFRFFTDQGLERHLLGSHGLVTSSMQDAANKSKDSGRCPVCGRVYQWKLLNHVARDHNMTLKPAHLSYKCTVCTATFGMYKQFENHVYSAHSVVAKRVMDKKTTSSGSPSTGAKTPDLKPLKINDEITIIPQPAKSTNGAAKEGSPACTTSTNSKNSNPSTSKNHFYDYDISSI